MPFARFGLSPLICSALKDAGYEKPTEIQEKAIPAVLEGHDVLASADTGTGKTAAFMLPALHLLATPSDRPGKGPRVLVLTPTRELASQVTDSAKKYGKNIQRLRTVRILGGMPYEPQRRDLRNFVDIMVATPGRLLDHAREGRIDFGRVEMFVLDEADRMLDLGFFDDVQTIADSIKQKPRTLLFSATMGKKVQSLAQSVTDNPVRIEVERASKTHKDITQSVLFADNEQHKSKLLYSVIGRDDVRQMIVFTATKRGAERLADSLEGGGVAALPLHGDMRQRERMRTVQRIRDNQFKVLVATDVAARGIDLPGVSHVVNFDLPRTAEDYTHRIGRTGRAGVSGHALTLLAGPDRRRIRFIERELGHPINVETIVGLEPAIKADGPAGDRRDRGSRNKRRSGGKQSRDFNRGGSYRGDQRSRDGDRGRSFGRDRDTANGRSEDRDRNNAAPRREERKFSSRNRTVGADQANMAARADRADRPDRSNFNSERSGGNNNHANRSNQRHGKRSGGSFRGRKAYGA